jgi:membrane-associated protease RseP (regulator of RpoE activity)
MTFITTLIAGSVLNGVIPWETPEKIYLGLPFSLTLLLILLTHEFSHYFMSRRHNVSATLPYFIPAPTLIGTFGAVIKMKPPIFDRRALIDIGASGPIGGFAVSIVAAVVGLSYSEVLPVKEIQEAGGAMSLGNSIIFHFIGNVIMDFDPARYDIILHPVAFAGWVGFLVTSINLLPIGQLDGGHISYALFGERHRLISIGLILLLIVLGIVYSYIWIIWALLMVVIGYRHPPVVYPQIQLDRKRRAVGWISLVIFILTFTPIPVRWV